MKELVQGNSATVSISSAKQLCSHFCVPDLKTTGNFMTQGDGRRVAVLQISDICDLKLRVALQ